MRSDIRPENVRNETIESVTVLWASLLPCAEDEAHHLGGNQLLWEKREHHEESLYFQRQPVRLGRLPRTLRIGVMTVVALVCTFFAK